MARAATTTDVFNAIAEAHRRAILDALVDGLVRMRAVGRNRLYRLEAPALAPLQRWLATYEQLINARYDRLDDYLAELQAGGRIAKPPTSVPKKGNPS